MKQIVKKEVEVAIMEVKRGTKHIGYLDQYILITIYRAMAFNLFLLSPCYAVVLMPHNLEIDESAKKVFCQSSSYKNGSFLFHQFLHK